MRKNKGFTLMELLIVVGVIVVLAGIAIPTFRNAQIRANQEADIQAVSALYTDMQSMYEIHGKADPQSVSGMKEVFNGDPTNQLAGLDLNGGWQKGNTVTITEQNGTFTASYS